MMKTGDTKSNLVLNSGDTVYIPQGKQKTDWWRVIGVAVSVGYLLGK
jgi:ribosomal protein L24